MLWYPTVPTGTPNYHCVHRAGAGDICMSNCYKSPSKTLILLQNQACVEQTKLGKLCEKKRALSSIDLQFLVKQTGTDCVLIRRLKRSARGEWAEGWMHMPAHLFDSICLENLAAMAGTHLN